MEGAKSLIQAIRETWFNWAWVAIAFCVGVVAGIVYSVVVL